jgi:hypothetical protein
MADGVIIAQVGPHERTVANLPRESRTDILEEQSMSGYSEESAVRARRLGGIAFLALAWLGPPVPGAQAEERTDQLETVIVTGSFVPRTDIQTPSPLTVISAEDIAQSGLTSTTDIVRTLTADNSGLQLPTNNCGFSCS